MGIRRCLSFFEVTRPPQKSWKSSCHSSAWSVRSNRCACLVLRSALPLPPRASLAAGSWSALVGIRHRWPFPLCSFYLGSEQPVPHRRFNWRRRQLQLPPSGGFAVFSRGRWLPPLGDWLSRTPRLEFWRSSLRLPLGALRHTVRRICGARLGRVLCLGRVRSTLRLRGWRLVQGLSSWRVLPRRQ
jgi:hypothetical protein